ncbi:MAG: hypothetical protein LBK61_03160 [Spirochaetaceae bacterium]|nr:hypothetical protein [Spirochaetaceae bacterium]
MIDRNAELVPLRGNEGRRQRQAFGRTTCRGGEVGATQHERTAGSPCGGVEAAMSGKHLGAPPAVEAKWARRNMNGRWCPPTGEWKRQ